MRISWLEIAVGTTSLAFWAIAWQVRRMRARRRLHEVETGERCVSCDGTNLERAGETTRCTRCGYVVSLARLAAVRVNPVAVDDLVTPPRDWH
ncbi:MAG: hypothetical protein IT377_02210 [Polyangiaceae bacterium]|nr:hypothetical protein [Polyangiaceae bacterium]